MRKDFEGRGLTGASVAMFYDSSNDPSAVTPVEEEVNAKTQSLIEHVRAMPREALEKLVVEAAAHGRILLDNGGRMTKEGAKTRRGFFDGCFDMMHSGHMNALRQAKQLCDHLVVGVHSDEEILRNKGPPVMNQEERYAAVAMCKYVDEIVYGTPYSPPLSLLDELKCDVVIHGDDLPKNANGTSTYGAAQAAGRLLVIKRTEGISTTDIVGRMLLMTKGHHLENQDDSSSSSPAHFLPLTRRIVQFSGGRVPSPEHKVVYIHGSFDMFHIGHMETLKKSREMGDFLYVGLHTDRVINERKKQNYPIMNLHERTLMVLSCKYVDEVIMGAPMTITEDLVKTLNVGVVVEGPVCSSGTRHGDSDPYRVAKAMGIYERIESARDTTTDTIVSRVVANREAYVKRNADRGQREARYYREKEAGSVVEL